MARMYNPHDPSGEGAKFYAQRRPANHYRARGGYPTYRRGRDAFDWVQGGYFLFAGLVIIFVVVMFGTYIVGQTKTDTITCTVIDKDRAANRNGGSDMRVYTEDCGTLSVGDSVLDGTWSSADTYAEITPGATYTFDTRGIRVPIFSMFPKIVEVR